MITSVEVAGDGTPKAVFDRNDYIVIDQRFDLVAAEAGIQLTVVLRRGGEYESFWRSVVFFTDEDADLMISGIVFG